MNQKNRPSFADRKQVLSKRAREGAIDERYHGRAKAYAVKRTAERPCCSNARPHTHKVQPVCSGAAVFRTSGKPTRPYFSKREPHAEIDTLMLTCDDLVFAQGAQPILTGISLAIAPGEMVAVLGANGAGKSTLLKCLAGSVPAAGRVSLDGVPLAQYAPQRLAQRRAVLPQSLAPQDDGLTVADVVEMGLFPHRLSPNTSAAQTAWQQVLDWAGIAAYLPRRYATLSGGEQQRVHLARVWLQVLVAPHPAGRYLLLDEPTAALDPAWQLAVLARCRTMAQTDKVGVLLVLHDLNLACRYADRVFLLAAGQQVACGAPATVLNRDTLHAAYGIALQSVALPSGGVAWLPV